ncbi:MAG: lytic transglycosylase domain-containing protein [Deltaproteobacteria bacterium]|nr:lytic transglycosylase domain-containing protein [Deltaproteobacteria bacterium]
MVFFYFLFTIILSQNYANLPVAKDYSAYFQGRKLRDFLHMVEKNTWKKSELDKITLSPFRDFALDYVSEKLSNSDLKSFLKNNLPICRKIHEGTLKKGQIETFLKENKCATKPRINLLMKCSRIGKTSVKIEIFEMLWRTFPAHPRASSFLLTALETAKKISHERKFRLERYLLVYQSEALDDKDFSRLTAKMPCVQRKTVIENLLRRGVYSRIENLFSGCSLNYLKGQYYFRTGKYKKAWESISQVDAGRWKARIRNYISPPENMIGDYLKEYQKTKNIKFLKRAVKTHLISGKDKQKVISSISKYNGGDCYLNFMRHWIQHNRTIPVFLKGCNSGSEKARNRYWNWKTSKNMDRPDFIWKRSVPEEAYYRNIFESSRNTLHPEPLPLFNTVSSPSVRHLRNIAKLSSTSEYLKYGITLLRWGMKDLADDCLYTGLSPFSKRNRRTLDELIQCWKLPEGNGSTCPNPPPLEVAKNPIKSDIQSQIALYMNWPHFAPRWGKFLPVPYKNNLLNASAKFNIPMGLLLAVMYSESAFDPFIISHAQAMGLFQIIPQTGFEISINLGDSGFTPSELLVPEKSINYGAAYLAILARKFNRNWPLVVAAYNAGPHQVYRWTKNRGDVNTDRWVEEIPFNETRIYVKRVIGRWVLYSRELGENRPDWNEKIGTVTN